MLLVDDDKAQRAIGDRGEDRAASADHHICATVRAAFGQKRPLLVALRLGESRVKDRDFRGFEARRDAADGLRGERDFGNEKDGFLPGRESLFDRADVDFRLSRARHAKDEMLLERTEIA